MVIGNFFWEYKNKKYILSYFIVLTVLAFLVYLQSLGLNFEVVIIVSTCMFVVIIICMLIKIIYEYIIVITGKKIKARIKNICVPNINKKIVYRNGVEVFENFDISESTRDDFVHVACNVEIYGINYIIDQDFITPFCEVEGKDFYKDNKVIDIYFSSNNKRFVMLYGELLAAPYYDEKKKIFFIMNLVYLIYFIIIGIKIFIN